MVLRAMLFDFGGTLDGAGLHWLDRFLALYRKAGADLTFERFRDAFDYATQCAYADKSVAGYDLQAVVQFHVERHLERLGVTGGDMAPRIVTAFVDQARRNLAESRTVLARLRPRLALGVVSNFYGNVDRLLADADIAPLLTTIIDSACVGVSKPDPAIFALALRELGCAASEAMYVGDSFHKDVLGAHAAGLRTAWLVGASERQCPDPAVVDVQLRCLADLEAVVG